MAASKCPNCSSTAFEVVEKLLPGMNYKFLFVQCVSCGSVAGVLEWARPEPALLKLQKTVEQLAKRMNVRLD